MQSKAAVDSLDSDLVIRAREGDRASFSTLVDRYRGAIFGVAYHYLSDPDDAQDAAQEAFIQAYLRLGQLRDSENFGPWLRRIAVNRALDIIGRRSIRCLPLETGPGRPALPRPEEDVNRLAMRLTVREALGALSPKSRLTVTLFYLGGYSQAEIARFLEVPTNTVNSRLQHARRRLKQEMETMIDRSLKQDLPGPEFTIRVVEEALQRAKDARQAYDTGEALKAYDRAIEVLDHLGGARNEERNEESNEQRLRMAALWEKGWATRFYTGHEAALRLLQQALAIVEELGEPREVADKLQGLGDFYDSMGQRELAEEQYHRALDIYRELGDEQGQAIVLKDLAMHHLFAKQPGTARPFLEQALSRFASIGSHDWAAVCQGALDLLEDLRTNTSETRAIRRDLGRAELLPEQVTADRFEALLGWRAFCDVVEEREGAVLRVSQPGFASSNWGDDMPLALRQAWILHQVSHLKKFLDRGVQVGGSWSGDSYSFSYRPLKSEVTVKSKSEKIEVPAGTFDRCLLMEQVTRESGDPDDAPEKWRQLDRESVCGVRRSWWARGVGLVQLEVSTAAGVRALIQLQEYSVLPGGDGYLPLSVGNQWRYAWSDLPPGYAGYEVMKVNSHEGCQWFMEGYGYECRIGTAVKRTKRAPTSKGHRLASDIPA